MKKRIKFKDEKIKKVFIMSEESKEEWAIKNGYSKELKEVELGFDGFWYLKGYSPKKDFNFEKKEKLNSFYEYDKNFRMNGTVEHKGKNFSISEDAKVNLMAVVNQASIFKTDIVYYEKNGTKGVYTLEEFMPYALAISNGIAKAETDFYDTEAKINNAKTEEELEQIKW